MDHAIDESVSKSIFGHKMGIAFERDKGPIFAASLAVIVAETELPVLLFLNSANLKKFIFFAL